MKKNNIFKRLSKALFYDEDRKKLSRTALMNFIYFTLSVTITIAGVLFVIIPEKPVLIPNELYLFIGTLCGSGFLQYSFGKKIANNKKDEID